MDSLLQDLRFALRLLLRNPGIAVASTVALALGIGVNTVVFTGLDEILFVTPPAEDASGLVRVFAHHKPSGQYGEAIAYPIYRDLVEQSDAFSGAIIHHMHRAALTFDGNTSIRYGELVTSDYFEFLGRNAALGTVFRSGDGTGNEPVVVLSHALWHDLFASDPAIVGKTVLLDGQAFTALGVMGPRFLGTEYALSMDFWIPLSAATQTAYPFIRDQMNDPRRVAWDPPILRLKEGVTFGQAQSEMAVVSQRLEENYPEILKDADFRLTRAVGPPLPPDGLRVGRLSGVAAMALMGLVLLLACTNVSGLLIARAERRRQEMAVRVATGAGRFRILQQLLTESLILAAVGGMAALALTYWVAPRLWDSLLPYQQYRWGLEFAPNARIFVFGLAATAAAGILSGLVPALQAFRRDVASSLKNRDGANMRSKGLEILVGGQLAVAFVILSAAGLFGWSLANAHGVDVGFEKEKVLMMSMDLSVLQLEPEAGQVFYEEIKNQVERIPGVAAVSWTSNVPLDAESAGSSVWAEGVTLTEAETESAELYSVGPDFLESMGIRLLGGRMFNAYDRPDHPAVAIVSQSLASRAWPNEKAVGRKIRLGGPDSEALTVVGVVGDIRHHTLWEGTRHTVLTSLTQAFDETPIITVRTTGDPRGLVAAIRQTVSRADPRIPIFNIETMSQHLEWSAWLPRLGASLAVLFGVLAIVLVAVGIHAIVAYSVSCRTREIGIRMALGANVARVARLVSSQSARLLALGAGVGLAATTAGARMLEPLLLGISGPPWLVMGGSTLLLTIVVAVATFGPVYRATRVNPVVAMRAD